MALVALAVVLVMTNRGGQASDPGLVLTGIARTPSPTPTATPTPAGLSETGAASTETATPEPPPSAVAPLLPEITPPAEGQVYHLTPEANSAGWVRQDDDVANHLGDYNVYAGIFDGQVHLGLVQFDLSVVPLGAPVLYADLTLVGLSDKWLGGEGTWTVQILDSWLGEDWMARTYAEVADPDNVALDLEASLTAADLKAGQANTLVFGPGALETLQALALSGRVSFRVTGPVGGADNLFSWDSGYGSASQGWLPVLRIVAGPAPAVPPPTPTPYLIIITSTPTPENILTRAALDATATVQATTTGTPTPLPGNWVTPLVIVPTATPGNAATAQWNAQVATVVAQAYGTPTPLPPNVWTATPQPAPVVVTNTPTPANWSTAVARAEIDATRRAAGETPTRLPAYYITATPGPAAAASGPYVLVTSTATPANYATASARSAQATIVALSTGTYTPVPRTWVTATPLPLLVPVNRLTPTATPTPAGVSGGKQIPASLRGRIVFYSDRLGSPQLFAMDADGGNVAWLTQSYPYDLAMQQEAYAPDDVRRIIVQGDNRGVPQLYLQDPRYNLISPVTRMTGMCYDPAWAPNRDRIAFVSTEPGNDEIYLVDPDGSRLDRLTANDWEWDKHPSWSPDGTQIVFYSNRYTGRRQIWIMNADGTGQRNLSNNEYSDWDPVWIK